MFLRFRRNPFVFCQYVSQCSAAAELSNCGAAQWSPLVMRSAQGITLCTAHWASTLHRSWIAKHNHTNVQGKNWDFPLIRFHTQSSLSHQRLKVKSLRLRTVGEGPQSNGRSCGQWRSALFNGRARPCWPFLLWSWGLCGCFWVPSYVRQVRLLTWDLCTCRWGREHSYPQDAKRKGATLSSHSLSALIIGGSACGILASFPPPTTVATASRAQQNAFAFVSTGRFVSVFSQRVIMLQWKVFAEAPHLPGKKCLTATYLLLLQRFLLSENCLYCFVCS